MNRSTTLAALVASAAILASVSMASADIVYQTSPATNLYAPIDSSLPAGYKFGESGFFGAGNDAPVLLTDIILGLTTISSTPTVAGTTDILFTFNDGDPSGQVYGTARQLYATTIKDVVLPATDGVHASFFNLTIPLPGVSTLGGFNNVGWSIGVTNFKYAGRLGFQNSGDFNNVGYFTETESEYDPSTASWSSYNFGTVYPDNIANFVATVDGVLPEPTTLTGAVAALTLMVRQRRAV